MIRRSVCLAVSIVASVIVASLPAKAEGDGLSLKSRDQEGGTSPTFARESLRTQI